MKTLCTTLLALLFINGCSDAPPDTSIVDSGAVAFTIDKTSAPTAVQTVTATLSRSGHSSITKSINIVSDTSTTIFFQEVAVGTWHVRVDATDALGVLLYTGEADVPVQENSMAVVNLVLTPVSSGIGSVKINVMWGEPAAAFPKSYGGSGRDLAMCLTESGDGGYLIGGLSYSAGSGGDAWIVKVDAKGGVLWSKNYGTSGEDRFNDIVRTPDGGLLCAGYCNGDGEDSWIVKLDSLGNKEWEKKYGGSGADAFLKIKRAADESYMLCGYYLNEKFYEGRVAKVTPNGTLVWSKTYGGPGGDFAMNILPLSDGTSIVIGNNGSIPNRSYDFWVFKITASGDTLWQKNFGGANDDRTAGIAALPEGGFVITGYTTSFGNGNMDSWFMRLSADGEMVWNKVYGGAGSEYLLNVERTAAGDFVAAGYTSSFGLGQQGWMVKFNAVGIIQWSRTYGGSKAESISEHILLADGAIAFAGSTQPPQTNNEDYWFGITTADGSLK